MSKGREAWRHRSAPTTKILCYWERLMPRVLISTEVLLHVEGPHTRLLREAGFEVVFPQNRQFARGICGLEESLRELSVADAMLAGSEYVTAEMLAALPNLRVIARTGVGYDRIDIDAATRHNVVVTITPTANHAAVAEHALALLFAISKKLLAGDRATRAGQWPRDLTEPIRGKTIGILGLGRTGRSMALRSAALGMSVIAHDPYPDRTFAAANGVELVDLDTLATRSDVLSIHCPANESTRGIINAAVFARMKPTAMLINTARGSIVDEAALVDALRAGQIKAAGLDVFEQEPPAQDNPLFELDNVVLTPHSAGGETLALHDMAMESAECVVKLHRAEWPEGAVVNNQLKDGWVW